MHRHVINAICHINDILNKIIILFYLFHVKTLNHILWNISKDSPFTEVLPLFYIRFQPDFPTSSFFLSSLHLHSVTVLIMVYFSHGWGCFTHSAYSIGAWSAASDARHVSVTMTTTNFTEKLKWVANVLNLFN